MNGCNAPLAIQKQIVAQQLPSNDMHTHAKLMGSVMLHRHKVREHKFRAESGTKNVACDNNKTAMIIKITFR